MRMKNYIVLIISFWVISFHLNAQNWELVWSDEFNYSGLPDGNKWEFEVHGPGWVNDERQNYTNKRLENCRVENGRLVIEARRDWYNGHEYSSARLRTAHKGDWLYGRMEVRAKLPAGRGTWPAIWMLPTDWSYGGWPASGEIDIMEYVGYQPDVVHSSVHTRDRNFMNNNNFTVQHYNSSVEEQFHVYAVEWYRDRLDFYVDNTKIGTYGNGGSWTVWPFDKRFHMILNLAIGGKWGGAQGIDNNIFPTRMEVDYVRVFKESDIPTGVTNLAGIYRLQNRHSGLFMDVEGNSSNDGANIHQWTGNNCACQQFEFTHLGGGTYKIIAKNSGKSLDVASFSTADGANILQWPYHGGTNQQYIVQSTGDGYYRILAKNSLKMVEVGGWSTSPGGNVQQWSNLNQASGHWKLIPVVDSKVIQAESFSAMAGVQTETTTDAGGGQNVGWVDPGDWMAYNNINFPTSGSYKIEYRVAGFGGRLSADLNGGAVVLGTINVPSTNGWQNWTTISHTVNVNAGTYNFGLFAITGGYNINWIKISKVESGRTGSAPDDVSSLAETVEVYPNPATSQLYININLRDNVTGSARIFNSLGEEVISGINTTDEVIDISALPTGIYTLQIYIGGQQVYKRFVKE